MSDVPGFFQQFSPIFKVIEGGGSPKELRTPTFTLRDWEMLQELLKFGDQPTNSQIGEQLGMTNGAVSARIKRLSKLGLIHVEHFNATDTGKNNRRTIKILHVPEKPWSPE